MAVEYPSEAMAKLRQGTEILRLGGGVVLTAKDCNSLLDYIEDTQRRLATILHEGVEIDD